MAVLLPLYCLFYWLFICLECLFISRSSMWPFYKHTLPVFVRWQWLNYFAGSNNIYSVRMFNNTRKHSNICIQLPLSNACSVTHFRRISRCANKLMKRSNIACCSSQIILFDMHEHTCTCLALCVCIIEIIDGHSTNYEVCTCTSTFTCTLYMYVIIEHACACMCAPLHIPHTRMCDIFRMFFL